MIYLSFFRYFPISRRTKQLNWVCDKENLTLGAVRRNEVFFQCRSLYIHSLCVCVFFLCLKNKWIQSFGPINFIIENMQICSWCAYFAVGLRFFCRSWIIRWRFINEEVFPLPFYLLRIRSEWVSATVTPLHAFVTIIVMMMVMINWFIFQAHTSFIPAAISVPPHWATKYRRERD